MERGIDDQATQIFPIEINRSAGGGSEAPTGSIAGGSRISLEPSQRHQGIVLFSRHRQGSGIEGFGNRSAKENGRFLLIQVRDAVDVAGSENIGDAVENRMISVGFFDHGSSALDLVSAMMIEPVFADHDFAEIPPIVSAVTIVVFEGVSRGAQGDDRSRPLQVVENGP